MFNLVSNFIFISVVLVQITATSPLLIISNIYQHFQLSMSTSLFVSWPVFTLGSRRRRRCSGVTADSSWRQLCPLQYRPATSLLVMETIMTLKINQFIIIVMFISHLKKDMMMVQYSFVIKSSDHVYIKLLFSVLYDEAWFYL